LCCELLTHFLAFDIKASVYFLSDKGERKRAQSDMSNHFITQWQPLSLNALLEYKQSHDALGQGEFGHGQKPVWSGVTSLTAV